MDTTLGIASMDMLADENDDGDDCAGNDDDGDDDDADKHACVEHGVKAVVSVVVMARVSY